MDYEKLEFLLHVVKYDLSCFYSVYTNVTSPKESDLSLVGSYLVSADGDCIVGVGFSRSTGSTKLLPWLVL